MSDLNVSIKAQTKEIEDYLRQVNKNTYGLIEDLVGKTSKNARSGAKYIEESVGLRIKGGNVYWRNRKKKSSGYITTNAYWDSKTKAFKTKSRSAKGGVGDYGLENFKFFERPNDSNAYATRASAKLTSNIANLHEKDVRFPKGSARFYMNKSGKWASYGKGKKRYGRHFFNEYKVLALQTIGKSQDEALTKWERNNRKGAGL